MPKLKARDPATGETVSFNWTGEGDPTDADLEEIFTEAKAGQTPYKPEAVYLKAKGIGVNAPDDEALAGLRGAAHPETLGDFASLVIPSGGAAALKGLGELASRSKQAFKTATEGAGTLRGILRFPVRAVQAFEDALPSANAREIAKFRGGAEPVYRPTVPTINTARDIPLPSRGPVPIAGRLSLTAPDVLKLQAMIRQGVPEADAVKMLATMKSGTAKVMRGKLVGVGPD